jgi:transketolase
MAFNMKLRQIAFDRRLDVLEMVRSAYAGHIGGSMSCMDILVALYYRVMDAEKILAGDADRDRFILSKGHCAEALYAVLADLGFMPRETLETFSGFGTALAEHPTMKVRGVEVATGALGHGLPVGVGMAIGLRANASPARVYALLGDGELAEGSNWEAAMAGAKYKLDNLTVIIDRNSLQITGRTEDVMPLDDIGAKFRAFGWECVSCDGHDPDALTDAMTQNPAGKPLAVIAKTVKGYGSAVMENIAEWHHQIPTGDEYRRIKAELEERRDRLG